MNALKEVIVNNVSQALKEDLSNGFDVSGELIPNSQYSKAHIITREAMILAGTEWFNLALLQLDSHAQIKWFFSDGDKLGKNQTLCDITANSRALLAAERVGLNFLQTLSGVATKTHRYVQKITSHTRLLDTRKTLPNLRAAQKYAVTCGGGVNHRFGLFDAFLIKENHIKACGSISKAVSKAQTKNLNLIIEVEVETFLELEEALECKVDRIMLDNFSIQDIYTAIQMRGNKNIELEVSGNVSIDTIEDLANTGVDFISVGDLTKSVTAIDLSLLVDDVFYE